MTNKGSQAIHLDSAHVIFHDWYARNPPSSASHAQALIEESHHGLIGATYFTLDSINAMEYNLNFGPISMPVLDVEASGDSIILMDFQIGWNFFVE